MLDLRHPATVGELRRAADAARAAGRMRAAAEAYAAALGLLPDHGAEATAAELHLARAECLHATGDYGAELQEARTLAELAAQLDDPALRVAAALREATVYGLRGETAGEQLAGRALDEARALGDRELEARSLITLADICFARDRLAESDTFARGAQQLAETCGERRVQAQALRLRGLVALRGDQPAVAMGHLEGSLELCRAGGDRPGEALALNAIGIASTDLARARNAYLQAMAIAEHLGDGEVETTIANNLGVVYGALGLYRQALLYASRAVRQARASGAVPLIVVCLETLGRAQLGLGQHGRARASLQESHSLAESAGSRQGAATALLGLARLDLRDGAPERAAVRLARAASTFAAIGARAEQATALALHAAADMAQGQPAAALARTARAVAILADGYRSTEFPAQEVWWWRYQALVAAGDPGAPAAGAALERAWAALTEAMATLSDPGLRRAHLGLAGVNRAVLEELARVRGAPPAPPPPVSPQAGLQDQLARLLGVAQRLNETRDGATLREMILDELAELTGAERILVIFGGDPARPERVLGRGATAEDLGALRLAAAPLLDEALRRQRGVLWPEIGPGTGSAPASLGPRSALAAPLIGGAQVLGGLYADVGAALGPLGGGDLELVQLLAVQAGTALENARLYEQIRRDKAELERLVAERTNDLQAANRALERQAAEAQGARAAAEAASAAKTIFLANVSHELRTPLNAVIGFGQLLSRDQALGERQRDLARMIDRSGAHLLALINDVIELAKLEAGRLTVSPAPFELRALMDDVVGLFRLRAEARGLQLTSHVDDGAPPFLLGDEGRLRQVLINLLANAMKFTPSGAISLLAATRPEGPHLRLALVVADTGTGIAPEEQAAIFLPFTQSQAGRRAREGSGLGLALSRQLARLMGGDIRVESEPGRGSTFTCEVLLDEASEPPPRAEERRLAGLVTSGRRYRVLVADASWQRRRLAAAWLAEGGLEVREAADGHQALALCASWRPHVALIATDLPAISGAEVARRIKDGPAGRATVLVALVPGQDTAVARGVFDGALANPVPPDELLEQIAQHLGLDLRYAEREAGPAAAAPLRQEDLRALPPAERRRLARAAADSDPAAVEGAIAALQPRFPGLAERLAALAAEFQFELIEALAQGDGEGAAP